MTTNILLIKLSSMGDVIHTLPALTDAQRIDPQLKFTWVVDHNFAEIPAWHQAVDQVVPVKFRDRDFRQVFSAIKTIRRQHFDLVIDAQGLLKSVLFARLAKANNIAGLDYKSCRDPRASFFYNRKYTVDKNLHAIERVRNLFAQALKYPLPQWQPQFKMQIPNLNQEQPYIFFLHGTTWESKHWPENYWLGLIDIAVANGFRVKITWATPEQKIRAQKFADYSSQVIMLPHLTITQAAHELNNASGVVAVDTGFAHLAAVLAKPLVGIFGATDHKKSGVLGVYSTNLQAQFACSPCLERVCNYKGESIVKPACLAQLTPQLVWNKLHERMQAYSLDHALPQVAPQLV